MGTIKGVCDSFSSLDKDLPAESKKYCFKYQPRDNNSFFQPPSSHHPTRYAEKCKTNVIPSITPRYYHSSSITFSSPCWVPAPSSTLEKVLQEEQKRRETWSRPQGIFNLMVRDCWIAISGTPWLAHRSGEGNKCSSWQFKRHCPTPGFPTSSAIVRFFIFLKPLCCWKEKHWGREKASTLHTWQPYCQEPAVPWG